MKHSTFQEHQSNSSVSKMAMLFDGVGKAIASELCPAEAAGELWTTPSDLALFILQIQRSLEGKSDHVLDQVMTRQMVKPGAANGGLGLQIGGSGQNPYFSHTGPGAVVMTNAQGGTELAAEIIRSISSEYGWPDWRPAVSWDVATARIDVLEQPVFPCRLEMKAGCLQKSVLGNIPGLPGLTGLIQMPFCARFARLVHLRRSNVRQ